MSKTGQRDGTLDTPLRATRACLNQALGFMHELGIATSILECVQAEANRRPAARITKVGVKIGELAGVDVDSLQFGFEAMVKDQIGRGWCRPLSPSRGYNAARNASMNSRMTDYDPQCPQCGEFATQCISGEELDIAYMEVDE